MKRIVIGTLLLTLLTSANNVSGLSKKVNINGDISFGNGVTSYSLNKFPIQPNSLVIGDIWYRETTDTSILQRLSTDIQLIYSWPRNFRAKWCFIATWSDVSAHSGKSKHKTTEDRLNTIKIIVKILASIAWSNPKVKIVMSCLPDIMDMYEHFNDPERCTECALHLIKCIFKQVTGVQTCMYDLGGNAFIKWYYHGIEDNDLLFTIVIDIIKCAGVDQWIIDYVKKSLFG